MNMTTQTWSLKHREQRFFEVIQNEILQPKDEKGADDAKKVHVLCELFFQQF